MLALIDSARNPRTDNPQQSMKTIFLRFVQLCCYLQVCLWSMFVSANTPLILDQVDTAKYGYAFQGTNSHRDNAVFSFTGGSGSLQLKVDTYDIDTNSEVEVLLNGLPHSFLPTTNNNAFGEHTISIPVELQLSGQNTLQFNQQVSGWIWGLTNLLLTTESISQLTVGTIHSGSYGYLYNGISTNETSAAFQFEGTSNDLTLSLDTYDIDTADEVSVVVNGVPVGNLSITSNNGSGTTSLTIPATLQISGINSISFIQKNPGWIWGIENLQLTAASANSLTIGNSDTGDYGYGFNGIFTNKDEAVFEYQGNGQALSLELDAFDIDTASEVSVFLNGSSIGALSPTINNASGPSLLALPALAPGTNNTISFQQQISGWTWGITNLLLSNASAPHLSHNSVHSTAYGNAYSGAIVKPAGADFTFDQYSHHLKLEIDTFDIDDSDEITVLVNDVFIGYLGTTANNDNGSSSLTIPHEYQIAGVNQLSFVQKNVGWRWGISNIVLNTMAAPVPSLSDYELVFNDEFSSSVLDGNKWNTGLLWGPYLQINNEEQLYVDSLGMHQNSNHTPFELTGNSLIIAEVFNRRQGLLKTIRFGITTWNTVSTALDRMGLDTIPMTWTICPASLRLTNHSI